MSEPRIIIAKTHQDIAQVKTIFLEYLDFIEDFLGAPLDFQNTQKEFKIFPKTYETLFLAKLDEQPVAACGIKSLKPGICELKRLYCRPDGRGHHLGRKLTQAAITGARELGYTHMYLDTVPELEHANAIYDNLGFVDIKRYYDNPNGCTRYMSLTL